jgi:hypothetical protein
MNGLGVIVNVESSSVARRSALTSALTPSDDRNVTADGSSTTVPR